MTCEKRTSKRYTERKSPAYPANECKGTIRKGNDGTFYVSKADKNSVYRWYKRTPTPPQPVQKRTRASSSKPVKKRVPSKPVKKSTRAPDAPMKRSYTVNGVDGTQTMRVDGDLVKSSTVTYKGVFSRPVKGTKFLILTSEDLDSYPIFHLPLFNQRGAASGNKRIFGKDARKYVKQGYIVWHSTSMPKPFRN